MCLNSLYYWYICCDYTFTFTTHSHGGVTGYCIKCFTLVYIKNNVAKAADSHLDMSKRHSRIGSFREDLRVFLMPMFKSTDCLILVIHLFPFVLIKSIVNVVRLFLKDWPHEGQAGTA